MLLDLLVSSQARSYLLPCTHQLQHYLCIYVRTCFSGKKKRLLQCCFYPGYHNVSGYWHSPSLTAPNLPKTTYVAVSFQSTTPKRNRSVNLTLRERRTTSSSRARIRRAAAEEVRWLVLRSAHYGPCTWFSYTRMVATAVIGPSHRYG